nr:tail fiber domain-containing protein [Hymenobacter sp. BT559]
MTVIGNICASGGLNCASDGRYKRDVVPVQGALASVLKLRGVTYYWKQAEFPDKQFPARRQLGFIAQEIEPYYPEMVTTDADGYKSVDYSRLTSVLVEAMKEQQQQIEALKAQNTALQTRATSAETKAASADAKAAQATATLETFEARLRRLEGAGGQAQR